MQLNLHCWQSVLLTSETISVQNYSENNEENWRKFRIGPSYITGAADH
jgi:hypothetical protein